MAISVIIFDIVKHPLYYLRNFWQAGFVKLQILMCFVWIKNIAPVLSLILKSRQPNLNGIHWWSACATWLNALAWFPRKSHWHYELHWAKDHLPRFILFSNITNNKNYLNFLYTQFEKLSIGNIFWLHRWAEMPTR